MAIRVRPPVPEWAQLTYTSADEIAGVQGGWGVKETTPNGPEEVLAALQRGVTTSLDEVEETPEFATAAEVEGRERRLLFRQVDGVVALWHAVAAGLDATGRPG